MTSAQRFKETKLPSKENFFDTLKETHITDEEYRKAKQVWDVFKCKNIGDYHDVYLRGDVSILADVFENFRTVCLYNYGLDPLQYLSLSQLTMDAALKKTRVELDLLDDVDMYNFIEKGIRGGISVLSHRLKFANNHYLDKNDTTEPSSFLMYLDCNNLYGFAMMQSLPIGSFKWIDSQLLSIINNENIKSFFIGRGQNKGFVLEVDLIYPTALHDEHSDYPVAVEKKSVDIDSLSPFSRSLMEKMGFKKVSNVKKLIPNLHDKYNYITHYQCLLFYLKLGLRVIKVHRILEFDEEPWLKPYIELNTSLRQKATDRFERDIFKLFSNALFGKTMENVRKRIDFRLITDRKALQKLVKRETFKSVRIFSENLVGVEMNRRQVILSKPIYLGFSILELSKLHMFSFHYDYMIPKYRNLSLLYTDTDSLVYSVLTEDFYRDMEQHPEWFDTSNYPKNHFLYSGKNAMVPGMFKDECRGEVMTSFCGLRAKMYSYQTEIGGKKDTTNKAKGVKRHAVNKMTHEDYISCLTNSTETVHSFNAIRSYKHELFTIRQDKKALSAWDDKRWLIDNVSTLAYGHIRTVNQKRKESIIQNHEKRARLE